MIAHDALTIAVEASVVGMMIVVMTATKIVVEVMDVETTTDTAMSIVMPLVEMIVMEEMTVAMTDVVIVIVTATERIVTSTIAAAMTGTIVARPMSSFFEQRKLFALQEGPY